MRARSLRGLLAACALCALSGRALAQEDAELGSGLKFTGAPTIQEIMAQQKACEVRKPPRKIVGALTEGMYRKLERIMDAISKNQYAEAEPKLLELLESAKGEYEKAIILQSLGFVYASTKRETQAVKMFERAVATNAMPQQTHEQMLFNIAQLYIADDKWDQGMEKLNVYLAESCNPNPDAHILLAAVHTEKKRWREALKQVDLALIKSKTPRENWLALKLALHNELKEFPRCAEVLVHLVALNPIKQEYWKQLSGILLEIRKDPDALAVLALAERRGFIDDEGEYKNLANMYMFMQIPMKAALLLERGLAQKAVKPTEKNLEALGNAWLLAREYGKAEVAMAGAAQASDRGELYKRLAQVQMEEENWKGALESLQKAQRKGGLKEPGEAAFLTGVCAVQLKQWKTAEAALRVAMQHEKTAKMALEWLNHLQEEYAYSNPPDAANGAPEPTQTN